MISSVGPVELRWRAIYPGSDVGPHWTSALPAVVGLVIVPAILFVLELPLALLRAFPRAFAAAPRLDA